MRVVSLTAENVKRLKAVYIEPAGDVVVISGPNASGKTSILDAIWLALGGGAAGKSTPVPIREGETQARVTLDLGDLKVTRTWSGDKTTLKVENADGARYGSPQSMLDALVGRLSFDPLTFAQQDEKTQRATLLSLVELPFNPDELDARRRGAFEQRTDVNRGVKTLRAQLDGMPEPAEDLPAAEVSLSELLDEVQKARGYQQRAQELRREHAAAFLAVENLRRSLAQAEQDETDLAAKVAAIPGELPDPAAIEDRIRGLEQTNRQVREAQRRAEVAAQLAAVEEQSAALTARLEEIDEQKASGLADAVMPLGGLGFDDNGVTYQGVPLKQASAAEQLRVSVALAIAMNPKLRVIRITDGSLLDSNNLALIADMAREHDVQCWIERVAEGPDGVAVFIEDGSVVEPTPAALSVVQ